MPSSFNLRVTKDNETYSASGNRLATAVPRPQPFSSKIYANCTTQFTHAHRQWSSQAAAAPEDDPKSTIGPRKGKKEDGNDENDLKRISYAQKMRPCPIAAKFNQLLSHLVELKEYPKDMALSLSYINRLEFSTDDTTLDTIFTCYCVSNRLRVDFGLSILCRFLKKGCVPDGLAFASMLKEASMFKEARVCCETKELFKKIVRQRTCDIDAAAYGALIDGLCRDGNSIIAVEVIRILEKGRPRLDVQTLNMIVKGCIKEGKIYLNLELFYERLWKDMGECQEREVFSALKSFYEMLHVDMVFGGHIHDSLICGLCYMRLDRKIYPDLKRKGIENAVEDVLGAMMSRFYLHGELRKARNVFYFMDRNNIFPDNGYFFILINGYSVKTKNKIDAMRLYREMHCKGLKPDVYAYAYNSVLQKLFLTGRCSAALEIFDELQTVGFKPNYFTYCSMLLALCQKGQVEQAFSLLNALELEGAPLHVDYYNIVIKGCREDGQFERAKDLLLKMEQVKNFPLGNIRCLVVHWREIDERKSKYVNNAESC